MSDEFVIDRYSKEVIGPEHAIYLPDMDDMPDINDYVKAVAAVVGVRKIRSAYRKNGKIKMYLRYRNSVDEIAGTTVSVRGKRTIVNRAWVNGTRILLTDVDSEVPNSVIQNALAQYGDQISSIITLGLHTVEPENSQIETNVRQVYLKLNKVAVLPQNLEVFHRGVKHKLVVKTEDDDSASGQDLVKASTVPVADDNAIVPLTPKIVIEPLSPSIIACTSANSLEAANLLTHNSPRKHNLSSCAVAKSGSLRQKFISRKRPRSDLGEIGGSSSSSDGSLPTTDNYLEIEQEGELQTNEIRSLVQATPNEQCNMQPCPSTSGINVNFRQYPFDLGMLENFLKRVKNNRNPLDVALQMLEENNTPGAIEDLCHQIIGYNSTFTDTNFKTRLNRLLGLLSGDKFGLSA